jgi:hypothetical protein
MKMPQEIEEKQKPNDNTQDQQMDDSEGANNKMSAEANAGDPSGGEKGQGAGAQGGEGEMNQKYKLQ